MNSHFSLRMMISKISDSTGSEWSAPDQTGGGEANHYVHKPWYPRHVHFGQRGGIWNPED